MPNIGGAKLSAGGAAMKYGKLVRDGIIRIIQEKGEPCSYHVADTREERQDKLVFKLMEECAEFATEESPDEAVDIDEVVRAMIVFYAFDEAALQAARGSPAVFDAGEVLEEDRRLEIQLALVEAAEDFAVQPVLERMAVFLTLFDQAVSFYGFDREMLEAMRIAKRRERGGFDGWIILDEA
ncbi:nucleoside triphosphate pyrophosphohydrolase [Candidatus Uhrbacteria bacterium]|nr:nucleoside triphosphate pyrophosphohydrolase [Candidatus Uhrbacteria bacterium]